MRGTKNGRPAFKPEKVRRSTYAYERYLPIAVRGDTAPVRDGHDGDIYAPRFPILIVRELSLVIQVSPTGFEKSAPKWSRWITKDDS